MGCSYTFSFLYWRRKAASNGTQVGKAAGAGPTTDESDPDFVKTRGVGTPFIFAFALLQVVVFMTRFPAFRALSPVTRMGITFVLLTVVLATVAISALRIVMGSWQELRPGDEHYEMVYALAGRAGVMVRHVVLVRSPTLNAFASVFGTVGLTTALVRRMTAPELQAVIAHELGHLHAGHARKNLVTGLGVLAAYCTTKWALLHNAESRLDPTLYHLFMGPVPFFLFISLLSPLFVGRLQRKREIDADRFAATLIGSTEQMIHALRKLHTLSAAPHMLKASDEYLATHPSLAHRIDAMRGEGAPDKTPTG